LIIAGTPLLLVAARQGSAEVMYISVAAIMAVYVWMLRTDKKDLSLICLLVVCSIFAYTPGIILWLLAGAIIGRKKLADSFSQASPPAVAAGLALSGVILVPLIIAAVGDWTILKPLFLIPAHLPSPITVLKKIAWAAIALFVEAPTHNNLILSRLPVLNILQDALLVFGLYALWKAAKAKLVVIILAVGYAVIAAGVDDNYSLLVLGLPALAVAVCAGLRYLYIEWRSIFPRNPVAHGLAMTLMWAVVLVQLLFGIRYAVVAWPVTTDTKNAYVLK
jgi:hypothetical protein